MIDVKRDGDMSASHLRIVVSSDNDVVVEVYQRSCGGSVASIEFCDIFSGGGHSPRTHAALLDLVKAIEEDNEDYPCKH